MKEEILKILQSYSEDSGNPYFPFQYIHDDYINKITDDIMEKYKILAEHDNKQIFDLERKLFNSETHYEILKENYDLVFKWVAEMKGCSEEIAFDSFKGWLLQENIK